VGATLVSEAAALAGTSGVPRNDPMAMRPFCGLNMADYLAHWFSMGKRLERPPGIFHVNWFRTGADGRPLWPGFGENIRVLQWILERVDGAPGTRNTAIGYVPTRDAMDLRGLDLGPDRFEQLIAVDPKAWVEEVERNGAFLGQFGDRLPLGLRRQHDALLARLRTTVS
jgi:phosphoenolpyruvate carboxykinase (GTP)